MDLAVAELRVVKKILLRTLTCKFGNTSDGFALFLGVLNLLQHHFSRSRSLVQVVIKLLLDEIVDKLIDRQSTFRRHVFGTQFDLGLTFKYWFRHINGNSTYYTVADVAQLLVLVEELLDGTSNGLTESCLMGTTLDGMLAIDK